MVLEIWVLVEVWVVKENIEGVCRKEDFSAPSAPANSTRTQVGEGGVSRLMESTARIIGVEVAPSRTFHASKSSSQI